MPQGREAAVVSMRTAKTACTARIPASSKNGSAGGLLRIFAPISASGDRCDRRASGKSRTGSAAGENRAVSPGSPLRRHQCPDGGIPGSGEPSIQAWQEFHVYRSIHVTCRASDSPAFLPDEVAVEPGSTSAASMEALRYDSVRWRGTAQRKAMTSQDPGANGCFRLPGPRNDRSRGPRNGRDLYT